MNKLIRYLTLSLQGYSIHLFMVIVKNFAFSRAHRAIRLRRF